MKLFSALDKNGFPRYFTELCPCCSAEHCFKEMLTDALCEDIEFRSAAILISV